MKKIVLSILAIICLTLILEFAKYLIFGNETIYIADYMPNGDWTMDYGESIDNNAGGIAGFPKLALRKTCSISMVFLIINVILTLIVRKIFIKTIKIFEPKKDYLLTFMIAIIPVIIIAVQLYNQMGWTC